MRHRRRIPPTGELRQSQVVTTFGPGSMVDLPDYAVLIGGLDEWRGERQRIYEERMEAWITELLKLDQIALYAPPVEDADQTGPQSGIPAIQFPTWFLAQVKETYTDEHGKEYRTRPLVPWKHLRDGKYYLSEDRKKIPVVPVRFVQACVRGHISDVAWYDFVRAEKNAEPVGALWLDEGGAGNDFGEIFVRDTRTRKRRPLSEALVKQSAVLGHCPGRQPWLGPRVSEPCDKPNRLLVRSASNAYFSQTLSVIAIPDADRLLKVAVDQVYDDFLRYSESLEDVDHERRKEKVAVALDGLDSARVWAEVERRKKGVRPERKGIKQAEFETLFSAAAGEDVPHGDFYARRRPLDVLPPLLSGRLNRVVLVHRLREVMAQIGFTRFEPAVPDIDGELSLEVEPAPLARDLKWLPAIENHGEGIFLAFDEDAVRAWLRRPAVLERARRLDAGFAAWRRRKEVTKATFPGLPYVMLHSLSHLLLTTVALECGYSASAIRERIYAGESGYGILLYTGSPGSEGTLGGLVEVGRRIEDYLVQALAAGQLCSNDPVCAQHDPANPHEERFLHGAACHGCLLIAETSCERRNEFLDRALVVPTVAEADAAFFEAVV